MVQAEAIRVTYTCHYTSYSSLLHKEYRVYQAGIGDAFEVARVGLDTQNGNEGGNEEDCCDRYAKGWVIHE